MHRSLQNISTNIDQVSKFLFSEQLLNVGYYNWVYVVNDAINQKFVLTSMSKMIK